MFSVAAHFISWKATNTCVETAARAAKKRSETATRRTSHAGMEPGSKEEDTAITSRNSSALIRAVRAMALPRYFRKVAGSRETFLIITNPAPRLEKGAKMATSEVTATNVPYPEASRARATRMK